MKPRSVAELEALLVPILQGYGLPDSGKHALVLLDQLRSLSGRLALKLLSAPTQQAEALGSDLNQTHTISLFGVQGGGKSYALGSVAEMASLSIPGINALPSPLATVIFHYSPTMDYRPEFTSMVAANSVEDQIRSLRETYGAESKALADVLLLVPADKLDERRAEYPGTQVQPLQFAAAELSAAGDAARGATRVAVNTG